jgi:hypothetical protein
MKATTLYNLNGDVSAYGLACGYVQREENGKIWKHIYMEHSHYHVRWGKINGGKHCMYEIWKTYDSNQLTEARKFYNRIKM